MKPNDVAERLGVSGSTLRRWTRDDEYGLFLSPGGRADGAERIFNDIDLRVLTYIAALRKKNHSVADIQAALRAQQGSEWKDLPQFPGQNETVTTTGLPFDYSSTLDVIRQTISVRVMELEKERDRLLTEVERERGRAERAEEREREGFQRERALLERLGKLERQLGETLGELKRSVSVETSDGSE